MEEGKGRLEREARRSTTTRSKLEASAGETPDLLTLTAESLARKAPWKGVPQVPGNKADVQRDDMVLPGGHKGLTKSSVDAISAHKIVRLG